MCQTLRDTRRCTALLMATLFPLARCMCVCARARARACSRSRARARERDALFFARARALSFPPSLALPPLLSLSLSHPLSLARALSLRVYVSKYVTPTHPPTHLLTRPPTHKRTQVLVALGAEVRLETRDRNWAYSMTLLNRNPIINNFIEKTILETGPYPLEPEDDEVRASLSLSLSLSHSLTARAYVSMGVCQRARAHARVFVCACTNLCGLAFASATCCKNLTAHGTQCG